MRILIACDKFKGTISATQANEAIASALTGHEVHCQPIADGGEGTAAVLGDALGGRAQQAQVLNPLGASITATYWLAPANNAVSAVLPVNPEQLVAFVDMSAASGLQLMDDVKLDPWAASTYGTGQLLLAAANQGAEHIVLGLGGSATNDGGAGLALALGYRFLDAKGQRVANIPAAIDQVQKIVPPTLPLPPITAACDVENPLLGPHGATAVYGAQKGVQPHQHQAFEARLRRLAELTSACLGSQYAQTPGAGAAGGLGFGLLSFTQAELRPGFALLADILSLKAAIAKADLVITGEGSLDAQSLQGKGPGALAVLAHAGGIPCVALCGQWDGSKELQSLFADVYALVAPGNPPPSDSAATLKRLVIDNIDAIEASAAKGSHFGTMPGSQE